MLQGKTNKIKAAAALLVTGALASYDPCNDPTDTSTARTLPCLQRAFRQAGCQATGSAYPTSTNMKSFDNMSIDQIKASFTSLFESLQITDPYRRNINIKKCLGVTNNDMASSAAKEAWMNTNQFTGKYVIAGWGGHTDTNPPDAYNMMCINSQNGEPIGPGPENSLLQASKCQLLCDRDPKCAGVSNRASGNQCCLISAGQDIYKGGDEDTGKWEAPIYKDVPVRSTGGGWNATVYKKVGYGAIPDKPTTDYNKDMTVGNSFFKFYKGKANSCCGAGFGDVWDNIMDPKTPTCFAACDADPNCQSVVLDTTNPRAMFCGTKANDGNLNDHGNMVLPDSWWDDPNTSSGNWHTYKKWNGIMPKMPLKSSIDLATQGGTTIGVINGTTGNFVITFDVTFSSYTPDTNWRVMLQFRYRNVPNMLVGGASPIIFMTAYCGIYVGNGQTGVGPINFSPTPKGGGKNHVEIRAIGGMLTVNVSGATTGSYTAPCAFYVPPNKGALSVVTGGAWAQLENLTYTIM